MRIPTYAWPTYAWPARSGAIAALAVVLAVTAFDLTHANLNGGFMIGYLVAFAATLAQMLRTRRTMRWTWLTFLHAAGVLVLVSMAATGVFQLYHLATG